jgi:hypothetical protein
MNLFEKSKARGISSPYAKDLWHMMKLTAKSA